MSRVWSLRTWAWSGVSKASEQQKKRRANEDGIGEGYRAVAAEVEGRHPGPRLVIIRAVCRSRRPAAHDAAGNAEEE